MSDQFVEVENEVGDMAPWQRKRECERGGLLDSPFGESTKMESAIVLIINDFLEGGNGKSSE